MDFLLELTIITAFLLTTLAIGIFHSRGIKTFHSYAIGEKNYSTPVLFVALSATFIGGNTLFAGIEEGFSLGSQNIIIALGSVLASFIIGIWIAPKVKQFSGKISLGEILETAYGKHGRVTGGIFSFILCTLVVAVQIIAIGYIFETFLGIPSFWAIILAGGVLITYATSGGIKAVTLTDIFQFGFLIIVIPLLFNLTLRHLGGFSALFESLPQSHISPFPGKENFYGNLNFFIICCIPYLYPPIIQRLLMAKDARQAKTMFYTMGIIQVPLYILICAIGLIALALNPELTPNQALPYLMNTTIPFWFKQFVILGLLAAVMSTADSFLNSGSIALVHDIIKPIVAKKYNFSDARELKLTRIATLLIGSFAIIVALNPFGPFIKMAEASLLFWIPTIIVPLIGTILGFRTTKQGFLWSVFGGGVIALVWSIFIGPVVGFDGQLPGALANFLIFSLSCRLNRKTSKLNWNLIGKIKALGIRWHRSRGNNIKGYLPTPRNMLLFAQERANLCPPQYFIFGVFMVVNFSLPCFMWSYDLDHPNVAILLRILGTALCVVLLIKNHLSRRLLQYIPLYWQLTVLYCLPFSTTYMLFDSQGSPWWLLNTALSLIFGSIILDWLSFILITFVGTLLGWGAYVLAYGFQQTIPLEPSILYMWFFSFAIGIVFSRARDIVQLRMQLQKVEALAGSIAHEMRTPLASNHLDAGNLKKYLPTLVNVHQMAQQKGWIKEEEPISPIVYDYLKEIPYTQERASRSALTMIDLFLKNIRSTTLAAKLEPLSILSCIEDALEEYPFRNQEERNLVEWAKKMDFIFNGNKDLTKYVIFNLIKNAVHYIKGARKGKIILSTQERADGNYLYFEDTGEGIEQDKLKHIFKSFYTKRQGGTGLGLAFCKEVVETFGGNITCQSVKGEYTKFVIQFPKVCNT